MLILAITSFLTFIIQNNTYTFYTNILITNHNNIINDTSCTHLSNKVTMHLYSKIEKYKIQIVANQIKKYLHQKILWLNQPNITIFDQENNKLWNITANMAELNYNKILYLYGYVYINNLNNNINFNSLITKRIIINLNTYEILTNDIIILHGTYFYSIGSQMKGNLSAKKTQLIYDAQTFYDI